MIEKTGSKSRENDEEKRKRKIVALNDRLRTTFQGGRVVMTRGVQALEENTLQRIFQAVQAFDDFKKGDDPYGEHDFGAVLVNGMKCFWKIDYFDNDQVYHSPDKSNPEVTQRVLTIMRAEEW